MIRLLGKREKFIVTSVILSLGFFGLQFLESQQNKFMAIGVLAVMTLVLFIWSLKEGLGLNATLLVLVLPFFFTLGVGLFWFLLPANLLTRLPVVAIYGVGIYALCLTANIYTVAALRTIALARAARGVGFVLTLMTSFLLYDAILSLRANIIVTSLMVGLISFPLLLQGLWTITLEKKISGNLLIMAGIFSLVMFEIAVSLHFWPTKVVVGSLFYTIAVYMLLGLGQVKLEGRLFRSTVREYLVIGFIVFVGMFFATTWGG